MKKLREQDRGRPRRAAVAARRGGRDLYAVCTASRCQCASHRRDRRHAVRTLTTMTGSPHPASTSRSSPACPAPGAPSAADVLEDLGFFVIDNLPPALIGKVAELARGGEQPAPLRARRRRPLRRVHRRPRRRARRAPRAAARAPGSLFLDASDDALVRRFEATRRRHPLADTDRVHRRHPDGARAARASSRARPTSCVDTSKLNVHELRDRLRELFAERRADAQSLQIEHRDLRLQARAPARRRPRVRLPLPPEPALGRGAAPARRPDAPVRDYVLGQPETQAFLDELDRLFALLLPAYEREGKSYLSIGVGCTGGRHRSVVIAEELGRAPRRPRALDPASATGTSTVPERDGAGPQGRRARRRARPRRSRCARSAATRATITAVVSVADDGGSIGPAPARPRRARARRPAQVPRRARRRRRRSWPGAFEHRFDAGDLDGPRARQPGDRRARRDARRLRARARRSRPPARRRRPGAARDDATRSCSRPTSTARAVEGQVAVAELAPGRIRRVELVPADAPAPPDGARRDRAPPTRSCSPPARSTRACSPVLVRPRAPRPRCARRPGRVVQVGNLRPQVPETDGLDAHRPPRGRSSITAAGSTRSCYDRERGPRRRRDRDPGAGGRAGRRRRRRCRRPPSTIPDKLATALAALL